MAILFWFFLSVVAWTYVGYPVSMGLRARDGRRPSPALGWTPHLSVVLAVRNEAPRIGVRIEDLLAQDYPADRVEILVVCNGCTDGTEEVARSLCDQHPVTVLVSPPEGGKAGALNLGVASSRGEVIVFADARQRFEPGVFSRLAAWLSDPEIGAVSGRLVIEGARSAAVRGVGRYWKMEVALRQAESDTGSVMGVTGAIYAIRQDEFEPLPPGLILDDVLVPMRIVLGGRRVAFEPDAVATDEATSDTVGEFRRKVRTMVGNLQILALEPRILSPSSNPAFWRYVSHKLLRVLAPICLLGMLASGALAGGAYVWLVTAQLAFYGLGALGLVIPLPGLGVPAGFLLTHVAALLALVQPRRGAQTLWSPSPPTSDDENVRPDSIR